MLKVMMGGITDIVKNRISEKKFRRKSFEMMFFEDKKGRKEILSEIKKIIK